MINRFALLLINIIMMSHIFANDNLEGTYCKTNRAIKIYLKVKSINDSLYYFMLKDYDTTNADYKQRLIVGTFIRSGNKLRLYNANCYPFHHFSLVKMNNKIIKIDTSYFRMYNSFSDIKGDYIKQTDSVNVNFQEFKIIMIPRNIEIAKKQLEVYLYDFPSKYSQAKKNQFDKNGKIFVITTVGDFWGNKPLSSEMIRFSLIEIGKTKERKWINTDDLEDWFK